MRHIHLARSFLLALGLILLAAAACTSRSTAVPPAQPSATAVLLPVVTAEPAATPTPTQEAEPTPTPTLLPAFWAAPYLPESFTADSIIPNGMVKAESAGEAALILDVGAEKPISNWVYALVAPFPSITDTVALADLQRFWAGEKVGPYANSPLLMDIKTVGVLEAWWGRAAPGSVKVIAADELLHSAWTNSPGWAVIPFEELEPRWKVLSIDGLSPLARDFDPQAYPLAIPFSLTGSPEVSLSVPATNRDPDKLTVVVLTGVTALVRGTSNSMYGHGITYPAEEIGPWLREADITHISNEIPFVENCPLYHPNQVTLVFCTNPDYIGLLEDVGTDVVELTGDHFADWGPEATLYTLELYRARGWPYYGGGENLADARRPVLFDHNGNRIAFLGCNAKGGGYAPADETVPGAGECDFDWLEDEVRRLVGEGYLPIVTFQHDEIYSYKPTPEMQADFSRAANAGAVIVSGSQAHQPHAMTFINGAFVHYGLGNLFFDQYGFYPDQATDRAFIDRHVFYDGRYLNTELLTLQFVDLARSRPMTPEERAAFLKLVFKASLWE